MFDFALFILKDPERLSRKIITVCLPDEKEIGTFETEEIILIGFGNSKILEIQRFCSLSMRNCLV